MKKKLWTIVCALVSLFFILGIVFAYLRPAYTKEATDILFKNELSIEKEDSGNRPHDPGPGK
ncbi:MAG: hypothetical protein J6P72_03555 [Firmicutes bacterium]|nr:hypothetical protein [Bacillota bacterium]